MDKFYINIFVIQAQIIRKLNIYLIKFIKNFPPRMNNTKKIIKELNLNDQGYKNFKTQSLVYF